MFSAMIQFFVGTDKDIHRWSTKYSSIHVFTDRLFFLFCFSTLKEGRVELKAPLMQIAWCVHVAYECSLLFLRNK